MKEKHQIDAIKEVFTVILNCKRLRKTPERYAIVEQIYSAEGHFTVDSLFETMKTNYPVSRATVYNTLELLLECGLIVRHTIGLHETFYEQVQDNNSYFYKVCTNCGKIKKFTDKNIRIALRSKSDSKFVPQSHFLYAYGLCNNCLKNNKIG